MQWWKRVLGLCNDAERDKTWGDNSDPAAMSVVPVILMP